MRIIEQHNTVIKYQSENFIIYITRNELEKKADFTLRKFVGSILVRSLEDLLKEHFVELKKLLEEVQPSDFEFTDIK